MITQYKNLPSFLPNSFHTNAHEDHLSLFHLTPGNYLQLNRPHGPVGDWSLTKTWERRQEMTPEEGIKDTWRRGQGHPKSPWRGFGRTGRALSSRTAPVLTLRQVVGEDSGGRGVCGGVWCKGVCEAHALGTSIMGRNLNMLWRQEVRHVFPLFLVWIRWLVW